ncbi:MAG: aminopeptidase P family protein [Erysipelothrix sp.]|nr:aminopeptidase P family protein [Erysipelothrix sp.]
METLDKLQKSIGNKTLLISNPTTISYLIGYKVDPGKRLILLIIEDGKKPLLVLNNLFPKPSNIVIHSYNDGEDIIGQINTLLPKGDIYVEGDFESRYLIPLLDKNRNFIDGSHFIERQRQIKDSKELELMKIASEHNDRIMSELIPYFKEGISEIELAKIITEKQSTSPLSGISFEPISVFTQNIADPHAIPSTRKLQKGDVILIDMGGIYNNYMSDMTRAFFFGRNESLEKIYDIVLEANLAAIDAIEIGKPIGLVDKAARDVIIKHGYGEYFTHRTGHGIGLDTHEEPYVFEQNQTLIENGMCFSIEPGIYIEGVGGIRIEDLVCIENDKVTILNKYPKDKTFIS